MKIITFSSYKGGVGKSTLSILTANMAAAAGERVLFVDLDHQRNSSRYYATNREAIAEKNIAEAFHREDLTAGITKSYLPEIDLVAGSMKALKFQSLGPHIIAKLLEPMRDTYDLAVFDTPPFSNNYVIGSWLAADRIITPARIDGFDLEGVEDFREALQSNAPDKLGSWNVVVNFYFPPSKAGKELEAEFLARYPEILPMRFYDTVQMKHAITEGLLLTNAQRTRKLYEAMKALGEELLGRKLHLEAI